MKVIYRLIVFLSVFSGACCAFAFDSQLVISASESVFDQFNAVLPEHELVIPEAKKTAPGQPVWLYILLLDPEMKDGKAEVIGSLTVTDPAGNTETLFEDRLLLESALPGKNLSGSLMRFAARPGDPEGEYRFRLKATDKISGIVSESESAFVLDNRVPPGLKHDPETLEKFVNNYYLDPKPELLLDFFDAFLELDPEARKEKNYTPLPILYGLANAFRSNPHLWRSLAECSKKLSSDHKKYLAMLITSIGPEATGVMSKFVDEDTQKYLKSIGGKQMLAFDKISGLGQLDALWVEFLFTGRSEPVRKIAFELREREYLTVPEVQKLNGVLTPENQQKLMNYLLDQSAVWSLRVNAERHPLVRRYLVAMLQRNQLPDKVAADKVKKILMELSGDPDKCLTK